MDIHLVLLADWSPGLTVCPQKTMSSTGGASSKLRVDLPSLSITAGTLPYCHVSNGIVHSCWDTSSNKLSEASTAGSFALSGHSPPSTGRKQADLGWPHHALAPCQMSNTRSASIRTQLVQIEQSYFFHRCTNVKNSTYTTAVRR